MEVKFKAIHLFELLLWYFITQICDASDCRTLFFKEYPQQNKILENHVIANLTVNNEQQCRSNCYNHHDCISYNTGPSPQQQPGMILCQLNNASRHHNPLDYKDKLGFTHRGAESPCTPRTCFNGGVCQTGFGQSNFRCVCPDTFAGDLCQYDKDECKAQICSADSTCINFVGSYSCSCNNGFLGNGFHCTDIDECSVNIHNCSSYATCFNTLGNFRCECNAGYAGDGFNCTELNECQLAHNCSVYADCMNVMGSYTCKCRAGFRGNGWQCKDINECATQENICPQSSSCANKPGTYTCVCPPGYTYDKNTNTCNDTDECLNAERCGAYSVCSNTAGSFTCSCQPGFIDDVLHGGCKDVNECDGSAHGCDKHADCVNSPGSYTCKCRNGFAGNGFTCNPG